MKAENIRTGLLFIFIVFLACAPEFIDQPDKIIVKSTTSVYSGPGTKYEKIGTVKAGTELFLLSSENDWHRVQFINGRKGWIFRGVTTIKSNVKVIAIREAKVRRGPGEEFGAFAIISKGKVLESRGQRGNWFLVDLIPGKSGWVSNRDVEKISHRNLIVSKPTKIYRFPNKQSVVMMNASVGSELVQIGKQDGFFQIRLSGGNIGWIHESCVSTIQEKTIQVKERTFVRRGANIGYGVIDTVDVGMRLTKLSQKGNWYEIKTPRDIKGWVYKDFITTIKSSSQPMADERPVYLLTNQDCNIRQGWGTNWKKIDRVKKNTLLMKIGQKDNWLRIKMSNEKIGWIRQDLVDSDIEVLITMLECNIREGHSTKFIIKKRVPKGTPLVRISEKEGWTRVYLKDGEIGWIKNGLFAKLDALLFANQWCNVRSGPSTQYQKKAELEYGTPVFYIGKEKNWYKIKMRDSTWVGYVRDDLLSQTGNEFMTAKKANIYKGPSTNYALIKSLPVNTRLIKFEEKDNWYRVKLATKKDTCWVKKDKTAYSFYPMPGYTVGRVGQPSIFADANRVSRTTNIKNDRSDRRTGYDSYKSGNDAPPETHKEITEIVIRLRTDPDTSASIIRTLPPGTELTQYSEVGDWREVMTNDGVYGWVHEAAFGIPLTGNLFSIGKSNIRKGPGTNYVIVTTVTKGAILRNLGKRGKWYNVKTSNNNVGWVREDLVNVQKIAPAIDYDIVPEPAYGTGVTIAQTKLFQGPSDRYQTLKNLSINTFLTIVGTYQGWSKVQLYDGEEGWVANEKIRKKSSSKIITNKEAEVHRSKNTQSGLVTRTKAAEIFRPIDESKGWYRIRVGRSSGWIRSRDVEKLKYPPVYVNNSTANVRRMPDINSPKVAVVKEGIKLIPLDDVNRWLFVRLPRGDKGWIHKDLVNRQMFPWLKVNKDAEVYSEPTAGSMLKGRITRGEKYLSIDKKGQWYKISLRGVDVAWVYSSFVDEQYIGTQLIKETSVLRMGPGLGYETFSQVKKGEQATWLDEQNDWWQIQTASGEVGWIYKAGAKEVPMKKLTASDNFVVYKEPGFNYPKVGRVIKNNKYTPLEKRNDWYRIQLPNGVQGWVQMDAFDAPKTKLVFTLDATNLYSGPGTHTRVIQSLEPATDLYIIGSEGSFYHVEVKVDKVRGYVKKEMIFE